MSLANIRKADLHVGNGVTDSVFGTFKGWEFHVEGVGLDRYRVSIFLLTDEEGNSDQGVGLINNVLCDSVGECRDFIRDEVNDAPMTAKEATALSRKHGGNMMIEALMELESNA